MLLRYKEAILYMFFMVIIFVIAVINLQPKIVKIIEIENNIKSQTIQEADLSRKLETLKKSAMEIDLSPQTKKIYKPEIPGLDAESSFAVVFDDIIEMAKYNGIKIYSIEYVYNPQDDEFVKGAADKYNVCVLGMQIIADYADLESFLKEVYKYPYLVNIDKLELSPYQKNKRILLAKLQIKLYATK
ncbi:MAG: type 4a pilus biogenesis protein PilO [Candidatus Gastranaerophilales bacterium]|nr:type 4a pilus biogenesis protein PilO [Candidatus Gastranaerophilales bacterium]